jgi:hypothetical protein
MRPTMHNMIRMIDGSWLAECRICYTPSADDASVP